MVTAQQTALVAAALLASGLGSITAEAAETKARTGRFEFEPGFSVGVRLGWGFAFGDRTKVGGIPESMGPSANYSGMFPIWIDAGYRVSKLVHVGAYFQYGVLLVGNEHGCPEPLVGCRAHDIRAGAAVHFHFMPDRSFDPWAGLGVGYERSSITYEGSVQTATRANAGIEIANVQAGLDVHPFFGFDWGPFASFSMGEYLTETQTQPSGASETYSLPDKTLHYFLVFGLRVQRDF